jgi:tetratricopeptide (TPR) repeat protein
MPPRIVPSDEALSNIRDNAFGNWPSRLTGQNRIEPLCRPGLSPSFQLTPGEKIYTTGSCFARNVEDALARRGFDVVNREIAQHGPEFAALRRAILNNYGIPSMFNELDWALNPAAPFDEDGHFLKLSSGKYIDVHLAPRIRPAAIEVVRERRRLIIAAARRVVECSTIVMTLGLVEAWFDRQTGRYVNYTPPRTIVEAQAGRFELHVLDYNTALEYMRKLIELLKVHGRPGHRILLTVSPVPLLATFTRQDVLLANTYSKSLLRVIAEVVCGDNNHIDYYPSYESVTLSDRKLAWMDDQHHVRDDVIALNVGRMIHAYTANHDRTELSVPEAVSEARSLMQSKDWTTALQRLDAVADELVHLEDRIFYADLLRAVGRNEEALSIALAPAEGGDGQRIARAELLLKLGAAPEALEAARSVVKETPSEVVRMLGLRALVRILMFQEAYDEAIAAAKGWDSLAPSNPEVMHMLAQIYRKLGKFEPAREAYLTALNRSPNAANVRFDYAEFLISHKAFEEARAVLADFKPSTDAQASKAKKLSLFASA